MGKAGISLSLVVDRKPYDLVADPFELLADTLRERLAIRSVKIGCREGVCGSCNVLIDGELVRSCLTLSAQADNQEITTVEGLGSRSDLHPLQKEFISKGAIQCGFCIPGFLVAAAALRADEGVAIGRQDVAAALSGNLCRCTGYEKIIDAVSVTLMRGEQ